MENCAVRGNESSTGNLAAMFVPLWIAALATCAPPIAAPASPADRWLPTSKFGSLTGTFDRVTRNPRGKGRPDDNHLYLWIKLDPDRTYECAINTSRDSQFAVKDLGPISAPPAGFQTARSSYDDADVREADFASSPVRAIQDRISALAQRSDAIASYGTTYSGGEGMHLIHLQDHNASPRHRDKHGEDGMLVFYASGRATAMYFKFATQRLPR